VYKIAGRLLRRIWR